MSIPLTRWVAKPALASTREMKTIAVAPILVALLPRTDEKVRANKEITKLHPQIRLPDVASRSGLRGMSQLSGATIVRK